MAEEGADSGDTGGAGDQNRCRLLKLAGELRNRIYEYALCYDEDIVVDIGTKPARPDLRNAIALTLTCKQINKECGNLVYELNTIKFMAPVFDAAYIFMYPEWPAMKSALANVVSQQTKTKKLHKIKFSLGEHLSQMLVVAFDQTLAAVCQHLRQLRDEGAKVRVTFVMLFIERIVYDFRLDSEATATDDLHQCTKNTTMTPQWAEWLNRRFAKAVFHGG